MALCTSPLCRGLPPTTIDLDQALADIAVLIEVANANDALYYGLHVRGLVVRPNMTFDLDTIMAAAIKGGYTMAYGDRTYLDAASRYEAHFEASPGSAAEIDPLFERACTAEFGATFPNLVDIAMMFAEWAVRDGTR